MAQLPNSFRLNDLIRQKYPAIEPPLQNGEIPGIIAPTYSPSVFVETKVHEASQVSGNVNYGKRISKGALPQENRDSPPKTPSIPQMTFSQINCSDRREPHSRVLGVVQRRVCSKFRGGAGIGPIKGDLNVHQASGFSSG